jgi:hypothetical protein
MTPPGICRFRTFNRSQSSGESCSESFRADSVNLASRHFPAIVNTRAHRRRVKRGSPARVPFAPYYQESKNQ